MKMVEHKVVVHGPAVRGAGVMPSAAGAVLSSLERSLRGTVDVAFRRSSSAGRRMKWLRRAGEVEFADAERTGKNEMVLYFKASTFDEVATEYYSEPTLFDDGPAKSDTAFDVFSDAVADVLAGRADSDKYDVGLLKRFHRFNTSVFDEGVDELVVWGNRIPKSDPTHLSRRFADGARDLYVRTPEPSRVRIAGRLDMIEASTMAFALVLPGNEKVRGVWKGNDFETLRALVNSDVAASGLAVFRPSGVLLRIDADALAPQRDGDRFFATVPVPTGAKLDLKAVLREQHSRGGMGAIGGMIPAEESDDEFLAAVAEMD